MFRVRRTRSAALRCISEFETMSPRERRACAASLSIFTELSQTQHAGTREMLRAAAAGSMSLPTLRLRLASFAERFLRVGAAMRGGPHFGLALREELRRGLRDLRRAPPARVALHGAAEECSSIETRADAAVTPVVAYGAEHGTAAPSIAGPLSDGVRLPDWVSDALAIRTALHRGCMAELQAGPSTSVAEALEALSRVMRALDGGMRDVFATQIAAHVREVIAPFPLALSSSGGAQHSALPMQAGVGASRNGVETSSSDGSAAAASSGSASRVSSRFELGEGEDPLTRFVVSHEAVHPFQSAIDVRVRLGGRADRLAFALMHPHMPEQPLAVVQVAMLSSPRGFGVPESGPPSFDQTSHRDPACSVDRLLAATDLRHAALSRAAKLASRADTALFFSATNCFQDGLQGLQLASLLLFLAQERLARRFGGITRFVTLSPIPGLGAWLKCKVEPMLAQAEAGAPGSSLERLPVVGWTPTPEQGRSALRALGLRRAGQDVGSAAWMTSLLRRAASAYLLFEKRPRPKGKISQEVGQGSGAIAEDGARKALDPVLNFHIQNGAVVARVCPAASNTSRVRFLP